jgi:hypothetical protein
VVESAEGNDAADHLAAGLKLTDFKLVEPNSNGSAPEEHWLAGAPMDPVAINLDARQSSISDSSSAAVITLSGPLNSERKTWPSGCSRMAMAIWRSISLIWMFSDLIVATKVSTSWRRVFSSSPPTRPSGARRSFASSLSGFWRPE